MPNDNTINEATTLKLPLKLIVPGVITLISAAFFFFAAWAGLQNSINALRAEVREANRYNWTLFDQQDWQGFITTHNTNVVVPDPNKIFWQNHHGAKAAADIDSTYDPLVSTRP